MGTARKSGFQKRVDTEFFFFFDFVQLNCQQAKSTYGSYGGGRPFTITKHFYWNVCCFCAHFTPAIGQEKAGKKCIRIVTLLREKTIFTFFSSHLFPFFLHQNIFFFFFTKRNNQGRFVDISSRSARGRILENTASSLHSLFPLFYNSTGFFSTTKAGTSLFINY